MRLFQCLYQRMGLTSTICESASNDFIENQA